LRLEAETERQAQELADLKLERERERAVVRQEIERSEAEHRARLAGMQVTDALEHRRARHAARMAEAREKERLEHEALEARHAAQLNLLQGMRALQVDLTPVLVAERRPVEKVIQFEGVTPPQVLIGSAN
jgi:hypothetical protein